MFREIAQSYVEKNKRKPASQNDNVCCYFRMRIRFYGNVYSSQHMYAFIVKFNRSWHKSRWTLKHLDIFILIMQCNAHITLNLVMKWKLCVCLCTACTLLFFVRCLRCGAVCFACACTQHIWKRKNGTITLNWARFLFIFRFYLLTKSIFDKQHIICAVFTFDSSCQRVPRIFYKYVYFAWK